MIRQPTEHDLNERIEIWGYISYWMKKLRISPMQLASRTTHSQDLIKRGISGEPVPIRHVLPDFVEALGLTNKRAKFYEETVDMLSYDECKALLKPPAMPPRQGNL